MYPNLRAEMARQELQPKDIAKIIDRNTKSARDRISGKIPFSIKEAKKIQAKYFPNISIDVLFEEKEDLNDTRATN